jgi:hypothetical protein
VTNLGLICQYVEVPQEIAFIFEYSTRTAWEAILFLAQARSRSAARLSGTVRSERPVLRAEDVLRTVKIAAADPQYRLDPSALWIHGQTCSFAHREPEKGCNFAVDACVPFPAKRHGRMAAICAEQTAVPDQLH